MLDTPYFYYCIIASIYLDIYAFLNVSFKLDFRVFGSLTLVFIFLCFEWFLHGLKGEF